MLITVISVLAILTELWFLFVALSFYSQKRSQPADYEAVRANISIIKPLKGVSPFLRENLLSFFELRGPGAVQIIFAIESEQDPVVRFLEKMIETTPTDHEILLVKGIPRDGKNPKNSNLLGALQFVKHPWIYVSDADVSIDRDHLKKLLAATSLYPSHFATSVPLSRRLEGTYSTLFGVGTNFDGAQYFAICARLNRPLIYGGSNFFHRELEKESRALQTCVNLITDDLSLADSFIKNGGVGHVLAEPVKVSVGRMEWPEFERIWTRWMVITRTFAPQVFWLSPFSWFWQFFFLLALLKFSVGLLKFSVFLLLLRATRFWVIQFIMGEPLGKAMKLIAHLPIYDALVPYFWASASLSRKIYFGGRWLEFDKRGEILN